MLHCRANPPSPPLQAAIALQARCSNLEASNDALERRVQALSQAQARQVTLFGPFYPSFSFP